MPSRGRLHTVLADAKCSSLLALARGAAALLTAIIVDDVNIQHALNLVH